MLKLLLPKALVALIWLPILFLVCYWGGWWLLVPLAFVAVVGMGEYYSATFKKGHRPAVTLGFPAGVLILAVTQFVPSGELREGALLAVIIVMVGFTMLVQFANRPDQSAVDNSAITAFGVIYVPLMLSFMLRLRQLDLPGAFGYETAGDFWHRTGALLIVMIPVWICDTMALAVGSTWGRHKLAPMISPGKTVEGALAGFAACVVATLAMGVWLGMPWYHGLILGGLQGVAGQLGDLGKSTLKRDLKIKDFGNLFGPHGGVLDRFDAIMFTAPLAYLYIWLFFSPH